MEQTTATLRGYRADGHDHSYDLQSGPILTPLNLVAVFTAEDKEILLPVEWSRLREFDPEGHAGLLAQMRKQRRGSSRKSSISVSLE